MSTVLYPSAMLTQDIEDALSCEICGNTPVVAVEMRCCPDGGLLCAVCLDKQRRGFANMIRFHSSIRCGYCKRELGRPPTYDDMVKVTPL